MDLNALDLNLIRVLDALWQERSASRAGQRIGLSQPAVSAALNRLRHALGDQLYVRRGNEMVPTPRAEELAPRAAAALAEMRAMLAPGPRFDPAALQRTFTLMGADFFATLFMPHLARVLQSEAPRLRLRMVDTSRGDVARLLQDDRIDMALESPIAMPDWVGTERLFAAPFVAVAARGHPGLAGLREGGVIPIDLYCGLDHAIRSSEGQLQGPVDDALAEAGRKRRVMLSLPQFHAVARAVAEGRFVAALPVQYARAMAGELGLALYALPVAVLVPDIFLYWHARHAQDPAHRWMRRVVIRLVRELGFDDLAGPGQPGAGQNV